MKRILAALTTVLLIGVFTSSVIAAPPPPKKAGVTQGELARKLVEVLQLSSQITPPVTDVACIQKLMDNGIAPLGGWKPGEVVKKGDLAVILVRAMKREGEVKNPKDPQSYIDFLKSLGINLDSVMGGTKKLNRLTNPVGSFIINPTGDPLKKRSMFNPEGEDQYGVTMLFIAHILSQFEYTNGQFRPKELTQI